MHRIPKFCDIANDMIKWGTRENLLSLSQLRALQNLGSFVGHHFPEHHYRSAFPWNRGLPKNVSCFIWTNKAKGRLVPFFLDLREAQHIAAKNMLPSTWSGHGQEPFCLQEYDPYSSPLSGTPHIESMSLLSDEPFDHCSWGQLLLWSHWLTLVKHSKTDLGCKGRRAFVATWLSDEAFWTWVSTAQEWILEHPSAISILDEDLGCVQDGFKLFPSKVAGEI